MRRSDATKSAILTAARERFAAEGYERATIRAIANAADIDPAMVMRYFGSKERLFAAAAEFDLRLPDLSGIRRRDVGAVLVGHFFDRWEGDDILMALLRAAASQEAAAARMQAGVRRAGDPPGRRALPGPVGRTLGGRDSSRPR